MISEDDRSPRKAERPVKIEVALAPTMDEADVAAPPPRAVPPTVDEAPALAPRRRIGPRWIALAAVVAVVVLVMVVLRLVGR